MRTTIEMKDEHRARLLELAARRGEKGFSAIVGEAIDLYLRQLEGDGEVRARALAARGTLSDRAANELTERTRALRADWR
jgi:predicted DNA-binding protein